MSNFAIEGLISGFNTTDLINAILDIQVRGPVKQIETRITKEQEKLTSFQALNAHLLSLDIGIGTLSNPTIFNGKQAKVQTPMLYPSLPAVLPNWEILTFRFSMLPKLTRFHPKASVTPLKGLIRKVNSLSMGRRSISPIRLA